jgi:hypothetical protein
MERFIPMESISTKEIDSIILKKMVFVYNAIENGWTVSKTTEGLSKTTEGLSKTTEGLSKTTEGLSETTKERGRDHSFVFQKKHEGKKEVYLDSFLMNFMRENCDVKKLLA